MNDSFLPVVAVGFFLILFAGTFRAIKMNLRRRDTNPTRRICLVLVTFIESLLWVAVLISAIVAAPHPITVLLILMFLVSLIGAQRMLYREESQSLNRWLGMAGQLSVSVPTLASGFAAGCNTGLASRTKRFVAFLQQGSSFVDAARKTGLPLTADTLAAITLPRPSAVDQLGMTSRLNGRDLIRRQRQITHDQSLAAQQITYIVAMIGLAWLIGWLIRRNMVPLIAEMTRENFVSAKTTPPILEGIIASGDGVFGLTVVLIGVAVTVRWLPSRLVRWVPWFGAGAIAWWRSEILTGLAYGIRAEQPAGEILKLCQQSTRVRWIRRRCGAACKLISQGTGLPKALKDAGIITPKESVWLTSAQSNGHLPAAIQRLVGDIDRRQSFRWQLRLAWLLPLVTVLVAIFVLAHAMLLFLFLTRLIGGLA